MHRLLCAKAGIHVHTTYIGRVAALALFVIDSLSMDFPDPAVDWHMDRRVRSRLWMTLAAWLRSRCRGIAQYRDSPDRNPSNLLIRSLGKKCAVRTLDMKRSSQHYCNLPEWAQITPMGIALSMQTQGSNYPGPSPCPI